MTTRTEHKTATKTLRALVLRLTALEGGQLTGGVAELAHAAFYAALAAVDPPLAARLHDAQERAAFTLSPLQGLDGAVTPGRRRLPPLLHRLLTRCRRLAGKDKRRSRPSTYARLAALAL